MPIPNNSNYFKSLIKPLQGLGLTAASGASLTVPTWLLLKKALLAKVLLLSGGVAGGAAGATFGANVGAGAKANAGAGAGYGNQHRGGYNRYS